MVSDTLRLTQFSPGAGCGCKISPADLETILKTNKTFVEDSNLLVGNSSKDDAAVYDMGNGEAVISTTDFFTPIVDDAFDFGRIAAVNAISDIFAMGGTPVMAIAILGWPLDKLPNELAQKVLEGARTICSEAGIVLAGGHSIDISDPIFGLAVTGRCAIKNIKQNNTATAGCKLFLTKPLGIGIITTAEKKGHVKDKHKSAAIKLMATLNKVGMSFAELVQVKAMTDITGFGLLGHLTEMCEGSGVNATIKFDKVPQIEGVKEYIKLKTFPGGTFKNWKSYGAKIGAITNDQKYLLCDPQTSGGLLVAVSIDGEAEFLETALKNNVTAYEIGFLSKREKQDAPFIEIV